MFWARQFLGDREAERRFQSILEMMRRPEVNYISVETFFDCCAANHY
jgi:hypothetical protein